MKLAATLCALVLAGCDAFAFEPLAKGQDCGSGAGVVTVALVTSAPRWLTVAQGFVYYASVTGNTVGRVPTSATGSAQLFCCSGESPNRITSNASFVFFTTSAGAVRRIDLSTLEASEVAKASGATLGIAAASKLYWTTAAGDVIEAALDGTGQSTIVSAQGAAEAMAVGADAVYWLPTSTNPWPQRHAFGGAGVQSLAGNGNVASSIGVIAADGNDLFWTSPGDGAIYHVAADGTGFSTVLSHLSGISEPTGLALDATHLYFSDPPGNTVWRVSRTGGAPQQIAGCLNQPSGLALDSGKLYWADEGGATGGDIKAFDTSTNP